MLLGSGMADRAVRLRMLAGRGPSRGVRPYLHAPSGDHGFSSLRRTVGPTTAGRTPRWRPPPAV
ncbi:hypothetical protein KPATCC21470_5163 [Kitasatospora purpeofusca]